MTYSVEAIRRPERKPCSHRKVWPRKTRHDELVWPAIPAEKAEEAVAGSVETASNWRAQELTARGRDAVSPCPTAQVRGRPLLARALAATLPAATTERQAVLVLALAPAPALRWMPEGVLGEAEPTGAAYESNRCSLL
jgi:hypothetical protein